jgi:hypothetical protein
MSLIQLVQTSNINNEARINNIKSNILNLYKNKFSSSVIEINDSEFIKISKNRMKINYNCLIADTFKQKYLLFKNNNKECIYTIDEFIQNTSQYRYIIYAGGTEFLRLPFSIIFSLNKVKIIDNTFIIQIPYDSFFQLPYKMASSKHHDLESVIYYDNEFISNYSINEISEIEFCNTEERNLLKNEINVSYYNELIYRYDTYDAIISNNRHTYTFIDTHFNGLVKGFFIETNEINNIENIKFNLSMYDNGDLKEDTKMCDYINFDKIKINLFCNKISDSLIYLPLDNNQFNDTSPLNAINGLYYYRSFSFPGEVNSRLTITFNNNVNVDSKIILYYLSPNTMDYRDGMCRPIYAH